MSKHTTPELADLVTECLAAAEAGEADLDKYLAQNPQHEATLRELASLAMELKQAPAQSPSAAFRSNGYRSLMQEIGQKPNWRWKVEQILWSLTAPFTSNGLRTTAVWAGVLVAAILGLGISSTVLADNALPGDPLYGVKTTVEDVRLAVAPTKDDVNLHARFAKRRVDEIKSLVAAGRLADVPQAAAGYETHVEQAVQALATTEGQDLDASNQLAAQLDQMLSEQATTLDTLASAIPEQAAPVLQQVQSASANAQNAIKQIRARPGPVDITGTPHATPSRPLPGNVSPLATLTRGAPPSWTGTPIAPPMTGTPATPPPATRTRAAPPPATRTRAAPPPTDTRIAPPPTGTPESQPQPTGTRIAPPLPSTGTPESQPQPTGTRIAPPPRDTGTPEPPPPPSTGTPEPSPQDTPNALPPSSGSTPGPLPQTEPGA